MDQPNLTPAQALDLLAQAAAQFRGNRQEHALLEKAIQILAPLVKTDQPKEP